MADVSRNRKYKRTRKRQPKMVPKKRKWVVRIVIGRTDPPPLAELISDRFLECLRYAGLVVVHRDNEEGQCFDLVAPGGRDSKEWSEENAKRMKSFGYNAVSAPGT